MVRQLTLPIQAFSEITTKTFVMHSTYRQICFNDGCTFFKAYVHGEDCPI